MPADLVFALYESCFSVLRTTATSSPNSLRNCSTNVRAFGWLPNPAPVSRMFFPVGIKLPVPPEVLFRMSTDNNLFPSASSWTIASASRSKPKRNWPRLSPRERSETFISCSTQKAFSIPDQFCRTPERHPWSSRLLPRTHRLYQRTLLLDHCYVRRLPRRSVYRQL